MFVMISPDILINYFSDSINGLVVLLITTLIGWIFWKHSTLKDGSYCVNNEPDYQKLLIKDAIDKYIKDRNFSGYKANYLRKRLNKELTLNEKDGKKIEEKLSTDRKTQDLLKIAKTLIETAKNNTTITFSELCEKALEVEWKGRKWLNYIARRLDIIGHCCVYDADNKKAYDKDNIDKCFPFLNGLTREKYSYKINGGFWQPFWKDLLPIKSYEEQTEENVRKFQQQICDKISNMKEDDIKKFLEKLKTFEPIYEDLKKK